MKNEKLEKLDIAFSEKLADAFDIAFSEKLADAFETAHLEKTAEIANPEYNPHAGVAPAHIY